MRVGRAVGVAVVVAMLVLPGVGLSAAATDDRPVLFGHCGAVFPASDEITTLGRTRVLATGDGGALVADTDRADDGRDRVRLWRLDDAGTLVAPSAPAGRELDLGGDRIDDLELLGVAGEGAWVIAATTTGADAATHVTRVDAQGAPAVATLELTGHPRASAPRGDGGLVLATYDPVTDEQRLTAVSPSGALDTTVDGDGHVALPTTPVVGAVASGPAGLAAAGVEDASVVVWRFDADGQPTTPFGGDGRADTTPSLDTLQAVRDLELGAAGTTVLLTTTDAGDTGVATLRLTDSGQPDPSHGTAGVRSATLTTGGVADAVLTADAGVVAVDHVVAFSDRTEVRVHRLRADLSRDPGFAGGGPAQIAVRDAERDRTVFPARVRVASDGEVLIAASRFSGGVAPVVLRVDAAGTRDGHPWCDLAAGDVADPVAVDRLAGTDRYATAVAVAAAGFAPGVDTVLVATGEAFPDALAGGPVAAVVDGPVLLVRPDRVPPVVAAELERLRPRRIVVLGGDAAVSPAVAAQLATYALEPVERLSGSNRYATAAAISRRFFPAGADTAFVATGLNFPDALAAVPAAAAEGAPILLVTRDTVPDTTRAELDRLGVETVYVLGGDAAVSAGVADSLERADRFVVRVSGPNRYATAAAIVPMLPSSATVLLATGRSFPDALAGGALAGSMRAPVVLIEGRMLESARHALATGHRPGRVVVLGGTSAVTAAVATAVGREGTFGYRVRQINGDGTPARWNPCRPVHWVFNPEGAYAGALDDLHEGVRRLERASGLDFVYDGTTDEPHPPNTLDRRDPGKYPPVWVGWPDLGPFAGSGVAGRAATLRWPNDEGDYVTTTGVVEFNRNATGDIVPGYDGPDTNWGEIILHELAHLIGLDHAEGLMAPNPLGGPAYLRPPDLLGLEALGADLGCELDP